MIPSLQTILNYLTNTFPSPGCQKKAFKNKPHITSGIKVSIKYRNKLYRKYLKNRTASNHAAWTRFKNKTTNTIRNAEKLYYKNLISSHTNSSSNLWKTFGKILNKKKKQKL